jgi:P-type conjugative transfer protein TrbJ
MKNIMRNITTVAIFVIFGAGTMIPVPVHAWDVVYDPTHTAKTIAAEAARAADFAKEIQVQLNQYQDMVRQGLSLGDPIFKPLGDTLRSLSSVYQQGRQLSHSMGNVDQRFNLQFPGYQSYLGTMGRGTSILSDKYKEWSDTGFDNARTALNAAGINTGTIESEEVILDQLVARSATAQGRLQAIQAGNEIAAQQVQQMQKLREMMATNITLQSNWLAQEAERASMDDAFQDYFRNGKPMNSAGKGF